MSVFSNLDATVDKQIGIGSGALRGVMKSWICFVALWAMLPHTAQASEYLEASEPAYPLDHLPRQIAAKGRVVCPDVETARYRGEIVRYHKPVRVFVDFLPKLKEFEEVVRATAVEVYGRAPKKIVHAGTYNCRRISAYPEWLSEHGLANAIDVEGFDFSAGKINPELPKALRRSFTVRLGKHWQKEHGVAAVHARFLDLLARRLVERTDIFRVLLGPSYPGHQGHFHFDMAPFRLVDIW